MQLCLHDEAQQFGNLDEVAALTMLSQTLALRLIGYSARWRSALMRTAVLPSCTTGIKWSPPLAIRNGSPSRKVRFSQRALSRHDCPLCSLGANKGRVSQWREEQAYERASAKGGSRPVGGSLCSGNSSSDKSPEAVYHHGPLRHARAATVIGCLKYGAGVCGVHANNPSAEVFLKEGSLNAGLDDSAFLPVGPVSVLAKGGRVLSFGGWLTRWWLLLLMVPRPPW